MNPQEQINETKHQIWLQCMRMSNCTPQEAVQFMNAAVQYLSAPLTPQKQNLLMIAASIGAYYIAKQCIMRGIDVNLCDTAGRTALHYSAAIGDIRIFEQIVNNGGDIFRQTIGGETPLTKACIFCQAQIVEWYLNNGLHAFSINDYHGKAPLQMLKLSGEQLYEQVSQFYKQLCENVDTEMRD